MNVTPKPLVLLLPGLLCDAAVWQDQIRLLEGRFECRVPDFGSCNTITAMAELALASATDAAFWLVGHSMGGRVALEVLRLAPRRVQRLALLDTGYQALAGGAAGEREKAGRFALLEQARRDGMRSMGTAWARGMVHPMQCETPLFETILDMIERRTPAIFEAQNAALLSRPDATPVLRSIQVATLVLCGRDDQWSPLARHEEIARLVPQARLRVIDECGHMATMEQPAAVNAALSEWLSGPAHSH